MIFRIYTGDDEKSHFEDLEIEYGEWRDLNIQEVTSFEFRFWSPSRAFELNVSPRRQYVIALSGEIEVSVGDGTKRIVRPGDVMLEEDLTGQGHATRQISDETWRFMTLW